jgi:hypothetical protein
LVLILNMSLRWFGKESTLPMVVEA